MTRIAKRRREHEQKKEEVIRLITELKCDEEEEVYEDNVKLRR